MNSKLKEKSYHYQYPQLIIECTPLVKVTPVYSTMDSYINLGIAKFTKVNNLNWGKFRSFFFFFQENDLNSRVLREAIENLCSRAYNVVADTRVK